MTDTRGRDLALFRDTSHRVVPTGASASADEDSNGPQLVNIARYRTAGATPGNTQ